MTAFRAPRSESARANASAPLKPQPFNARAIADVAVRCLLLELRTWPKPGLVSHIDNGSHKDMNADTFRASAKAIAPYLIALSDAGAAGCGMGRLRVIGIEAEAAMLAATGGINTHRGAIFGLGLLCAAAGARAGGWADPAMPLGRVVSKLWGDDILNGPIPLSSHGEQARRRFGAGGARMEAVRGFPSVYRIGLPALRRGLRLALGDSEAARVEACFALIAAVEDTNLLHRRGIEGLRYAHETTRRFIDDGGVGLSDWRARAKAVHDEFIARWLSPGGSADLLAMTLFVENREGLSQ